MHKKAVRTLKASACAGVAVAMASLLPNPALAAETETVGGITWTFRYRTDGAEIMAGVVIVPGDDGHPTVTNDVSGELAVPAQLGGTNVFSIGARAFAGNAALTALTLPEGLQNIGARAFSNCVALASVSFPDSLAKISDIAFSGCANVTNVTLNPTFRLKKALPDAYAKVTSVTLSEKTTNICDSAFSGCESLTGVVLPQTVTKIGTSAFRNCIGLTEMTIPAGVTSIGKGAFSGCSRIASVTLRPDYVLRDLFPAAYKTISSVTLLPGGDEVSGRAFENCRGIESVSVCEGIRTIGRQAFYNCDGLKSVSLPNSLTEIGANAFSSSKGITSVTMPSRFSLSETFPNAYRNVTTVTVPEGSDEIADKSYLNCLSLSTLVVEATVPPKLGADAFAGIWRHVRIIVPDGSLPAYRAAEGWRDRARDIFAKTEFSVFYDLHRGANAETNPTVYRQEQLPIALTAPTKPGAVFLGWRLDDATVTEIPVGTTGNVTLEAVWQAVNPAPAPTENYVVTKAQYDGVVWDAAGNRVVGVIRLKASKMKESTRKVKISGYVLGLDGKKKAVRLANKDLVVPESGPLSAVFNVKDWGVLEVVIGGTSFVGRLDEYRVQTAAVGGAWTKDDSRVSVAVDSYEDIPGFVCDSLFPAEEPIAVNKGKWKFGKAASVSWKKPKGERAKRLVVDTSKGRTNLSGIKLSYAPKSGLFRGTAKIYALDNVVPEILLGKVKLKKRTVKVTGVAVDGVGYGQAVLKKPAHTWSACIE